MARRSFFSISGFRCFRVLCFACCPFSQFCSAYLGLAYRFGFDFHPVFGGVCFHTFLILLPCFSFLFSPYYICRMDHLGKTVTLQTPPELRRFTQATVLPGILVNLGKEAVHSIQFLPGGSFRASLSSPEQKVRIESKER